MSNLSEIKIPPFRYFPTSLLDTEGPKHWARLRLLQACERLKIPEQLWPKQFPLGIPKEYDQLYRLDDPFHLPSFRLLYESQAQWKKRARKEFDEYLKEFLDFWRVQIDRQLASGELTKIKPVRDTTPIKLRYEWAARRICLNVPYKKLAGNGFTEARIKRSVRSILNEADLDS